MFSKALFLTCLIFSCVESARILGIFPMPGISHYILTSKLMKGLAEAGHDVVMVSPYGMKDPPKNGKYTDVILDDFAEVFEKMNQIDLFGHSKRWMVFSMKEVIDVMMIGTRNTLRNPGLMNLVESKEHFDVVIIEEFLNDALKVYSHLFNCPLIILSSVGPNSKVNSVIGNPQPMAYVAHMQMRRFSSRISLLDRMTNLFQHVLSYTLSELLFVPKNERIMQEMYPGAPSISELNNNVALVLLNSHASLYEPQHLVPNMIEIGGYFIDPPKPLPEDLQEYMDNATDGVIYFSMGSNLKSKDLPEERKRMFLNIFGRLKQRVIWKFEEDLPGKPSNVLIKKWCPQQDILAHPNMRLFITHGGLLSTTETIYHGVPILAIPVFGDQPANAARAEASGFALQLDYNAPDFTEDKLDFLIRELLTNPSYKEVVQNKSRIFHDRPIKPMQTAVYWVDYVIRHRGAPHLRAAASKLAWYELYMVDVGAIMVVILAALLYTGKIVVWKIVGSIRRRRANKQKLS
ncbi:UDP-glycosyltransferase UGT5 [Dendroctonus ponderosae]|uniref:UDP-glucuronosyltransferase n=1 Tax=Dendroctonus ponderosae TaxID=77166 RepID=J3JVN0_DENPD